MTFVRRYKDVHPKFDLISIESSALRTNDLKFVEKVEEGKCTIVFDLVFDNFSFAGDEVRECRNFIVCLRRTGHFQVHSCPQPICRSNLANSSCLQNLSSLSKWFTKQVSTGK